VGCRIASGLDPGADTPFLKEIEDLVSIVCPVSKQQVCRVLLAAVLLHLVEKGGEDLVVLRRLVGDLQTRT